MISGFIIGLHAVALLVVVVRRTKEGWGEALLALGFLVVVFAVGWTVATMLTNLLFTPEWFVRWYYQPVDSFFLDVLRREMNRDTISLLLLSIGEIAGYALYRKADRPNNDTPPLPPQGTV